LDYDKGPKDGKYHLCIKVCDDPTFFPGETVGLCAINDGINNVTNCGKTSFMNTCNALGGVCLNVTVLNVNDPPFFNESLPQPVLSINEQTAINTTVKNGDFKTGGAVVDLDDASGDTLVFSIECLSCPFVKIASVMRTTNGKVLSYAHGLSTGDVIKVSNVIGMPELSGSYKYYTITNGGVNQFYLNVDTTNFASGNVGTGGSGRHMYVRMFHDGVLRSTLVIQSNLIGSISVRVSVRDQGEGDPVSKFFVIDVIDLNDAPTLPLQTIKISEDWNKATLGTFSASSLVKHTGSFVASSNLQGFQAFDLDGIYYPANDPDGNTPTGKALNFFLQSLRVSYDEFKKLGCHKLTKSISTKGYIETKF
jgi:hypothetical protein